MSRIGRTQYWRLEQWQLAPGFSRKPLMKPQASGAEDHVILFPGPVWDNNPGFHDRDSMKALIFYFSFNDIQMWQIFNSKLLQDSRVLVKVLLLKELLVLPEEVLCSL